MYGKFKYTEDYKIQTQWEDQFSKPGNSLPYIEILIPTHMFPLNDSSKLGWSITFIYDD